MRLCECGCQKELNSRQKRWVSDACFRTVRLATEKAKRAASLQVVTKPCACGCGHTFTSRKPSRRFFSVQCAKNLWGRMPKSAREAHRAAKSARHPNTALIHEARADTPKGECIYCPDRTTSPMAFICGSAECRTAYQRDYGTMRRKRAKEAAGRKEVACRCGCGQRFFKERGRVYFGDHWARARKAKAAERRARRVPAQPQRPAAWPFAFGKKAESRVIKPFYRER